MTEASARLLDASGLICPLPVLRARKALRDVPPGGVLTLIATDPAALADVPAFCDATGNTLVSVVREDERAIFEIRKAAS